MKFLRKPLIKWILIIAAVLGLAYGGGRLYYRVTDGFTIGNITSDYAYDPRWEVTPLSIENRIAVNEILSKPFTYLGKGCQSYVFVSEDGKYILKFFKYQRFRPQQWLQYFSFLPYVEEYRQGKIEKKQRKLNGVFNSWKVAYENLQPETQLLFVHLNKSEDLNKDFVIYDKMGIEHRLDLGQMEFLLQRKADMFCRTIDRYMENGQTEKAQQLLSQTIQLILSEYKRGFVDNDHALMQNTGVYDGKPIHIDVGQFEIRENAKDPAVYKQDLFSKTYKFRKWLRKHHPTLVGPFEAELKEVIGPEFDQYKPFFKRHE